MRSASPAVSDNDTVYVPRIFRFASTDRLLTLEHVEGVKINDVDLLDAQGHDRSLIAGRGTELIFEQVFIHGFFHADPHPGNLFILPGNVICFLDFGMMGHLDPKSKDMYTDLIIDTVAAIPRRRHRRRPGHRGVDRGARPPPPGADSSLHGPHLYKPLKELRIGEISRTSWNLSPATSSVCRRTISSSSRP